MYVTMPPFLFWANMMMFWKKITLMMWVLLALSACSLVQFQPTQTIDKIDEHSGYRFQHAVSGSLKDDTLVVMMFSGGGTRAAALGYGVLETLNQHPIHLNGQKTTLVQAADLVYGVSGGSVLAAHYALHGTATLPLFEQKFLKQDFQRLVGKQVLSLANAPRLASAQFGRGDLLQEQFENTLFGNATFGDLAKNRTNRPFAIISATDMALGNRIEFVQENFDVICLNLSDVKIARAVAASSAVPLVFSPIVFNNNGGQCGYHLPPELSENPAQAYLDKSIMHQIKLYSDNQTRPYIHLLDGGLTDNLGMRGVLDLTYSKFGIALQNQLKNNKVKRIIIINVNAQNQLDNTISHTANVPSLSDVISAIINIPIDQNSQESLKRMNAFTQEWKAQHPDIKMNFISVNLLDLPESHLRRKVLNLPTSFYLPHSDVNDLKEAARILLQQNTEFKQLLHELK